MLHARDAVVAVCGTESLRKAVPLDHALDRSVSKGYLCRHILCLHHSACIVSATACRCMWPLHVAVACGRCSVWALVVSLVLIRGQSSFSLDPSDSPRRVLRLIHAHRRVLVHQRSVAVSEAEAVRNGGVTDLATWDCPDAIVAGLIHAAWTHKFLLEILKVWGGVKIVKIWKSGDLEK